MSKLTHVQEQALKQIAKAGGRVTVSRRRLDRMAQVTIGAGAPQRVALPSVDAFVRRGLLELQSATKTGETTFETFALTEAGRALAEADRYFDGKRVRRGAS